MYIKNIYKISRNYVLSLFFYFILRIIYFYRNNNASLLKYFGICKRINIVCPGPSAVKFEIGMNEGLNIFVNHASDCIKKGGSSVNDSIIFSADSIRAKEVLKRNSDLFSSFNSVLIAGRLAQLDICLLSTFRYIYLPKLKFDFFFGLITQKTSLDSISPIENRYTARGFGSLVGALELALLFSPHEVYLWGCDFGEVSGEKYFSNEIPIRNDTPHDLIKQDVLKMKKLMRTHNIHLIDTNGNI